MTRLLGVFAGVSVCLACAGDYAADDSAAVSIEPIIGGVAATQYPEAAYLNIDMSATGGYACSGTLIAPKVVLTAGHCVDGHTKWEVYVGTAYRVSTSSAVYDWHENGAQTVNPAHHDLGLVFLNEPVNLAVFPTLSTSKVADGSAALNVGRVLNGVVQSGAYQAATTLKAADPVGYPFDYYSTTVIQPGDSGGPVFLKGGHTIAAVNSGAGSGTQVLARVDVLSAWLTSQIAAHSTSSASGAGGAGGTSGVGGAAAKAGAGGTSTGGAAAKGGTSGVGGAAGKAGAAGTGGKGGSAGAAGGASSVCPKETEVNDSWAQANVVSGTVCGATGSTADVDWYSVSLAPGSHVIEVAAGAAGSDITLSLGVVSGTSCLTSINGVVRAGVTVTGATQKVCIKAASPGKKLLSYQVNAN